MYQQFPFWNFYDNLTFVKETLSVKQIGVKGGAKGGAKGGVKGGVKELSDIQEVIIKMLFNPSVTTNEMAQKNRRAPKMALKVILKANSTHGLKSKFRRYSIMHLTKYNYTNRNLERDGTYKKSLLVQLITEIKTDTKNGNP